MPGDLAIIPGVHAARLAAPDRPAVEPEPSLAPASTPASERVLPTLVSQGLRASTSMDANASWPYLHLLFELYAPLCGFFGVRGRGDERDFETCRGGLWGPALS